MIVVNLFSNEKNPPASHLFVEGPLASLSGVTSYGVEIREFEAIIPVGSANELLQRDADELVCTASYQHMTTGRNSVFIKIAATAEMMWPSNQLFPRLVDPNDDFKCIITYAKYETIESTITVQLTDNPPMIGKIISFEKTSYGYMVLKINAASFVKYVDGTRDWVLFELKVYYSLRHLSRTFGVKQA